MPKEIERFCSNSIVKLGTTGTFTFDLQDGTPPSPTTYLSVMESDGGGLSGSGSITGAWGEYVDTNQNTLNWEVETVLGHPVLEVRDNG